MALSLVGVSYKTAPVEVREKLSFNPDGHKDALRVLRGGSAGREVVLLSTCNRTEIYFHSNEPRQRELAVEFLKGKSGRADLDPLLYFKEGDQMVGHLFAVVAGLDSLVRGEQEIQKQVKDAYQAAQGAGTTSKLFNVLFQRALYVGKLVRTRTGIGHGALSVGSVAVSLAEKIFGDLSQSAVLLFGAGKMAEISARHLLSKKIRRLWVANRTLEHARRLAESFQGEPLELEEGLSKIHSADIIIASVSAERPILPRGALQEAMARRANRSLFVIDIAVPRNVEPSAHELDNLYLYNIDDLEAIALENLRSRGGETEKAQAIVEAKSAEFWDWVKSVDQGDEKRFKHNFGFA